MSHDDVRQASISEIEETIRPAGAHLTRPIRFLRYERTGPWRLKLYTIATHGEEARPDFVEEVVRRMPEVMPAPALGNGRHGVGFVIAHDAATASIAIYYWWSSFNELHQHILIGPKADPRGMAKFEHQAAGCVWELEVIDFERRAWLSDVLANPGGPDIERYLARRLDTEI